VRDRRSTPSTDLYNFVEYVLVNKWPFVQWSFIRTPSGCGDIRPVQRLTDGGRTSAAQGHRALSVFPELKVANFALFLSVRRTENRINVVIVSRYFQFTDGLNFMRLSTEEVHES